jgi:AP-3 complex subunit mu
MQQNRFAVNPLRTSPTLRPYTEVFVDIEERIDAIISKSGTPITAAIQGTINCRCALSGMPDLTLSFQNSRFFDDVALHPCVRLAKWSAERIMSFVPPVSLRDSVGWQRG